MKTKVHYFRVEMPEGGFMFLGGPTKPAGPGKVWLCTPDGGQILEVQEHCVTPTTRQETARRIEADRRAAKAPLN